MTRERVGVGVDAANDRRLDLKRLRGTVLLGVIAAQLAVSLTVAPVQAGLIGSYSVQAGPDWPSMPPTYTCLEACALIFGGSSSDYQCSTSGTAIDNLAWVSGYGDDQYCAIRHSLTPGTPVSESFKVCAVYDVGCYSAYVQDHCYEPGDFSIPNTSASINYCWSAGPASCGNGIREGGEQCDDGNTTGGDCCSADCQTPAPSTTPCEADGNLCTTDQCDGAGQCALVSNVSCQAAVPPCEGGEQCNPGTGLCEAQPDGSAGTPCNGDGNLCTVETCDGAGACMFMSNVTCQAPAPPCEGGELCNPDTGVCDAQPDAATTTTCEVDGDLCTNDHCDGSGSCVFLSNVVCTALDQCHVAGTCDSGSGLCSNPTQPDGQACDDGNVCTQVDRCTGGVCAGNVGGADTDGDGYCDLFEDQAGCSPTDPQEIPPQAPTYGGSGAGRDDFLITYTGPTGARIKTSSNPTCTTNGVCGAPAPGFVTGFCTAGRIGDPCTTHSQCNLPVATCRLVVNYSDVPDLVLDYAFFNRRSNAVAGFSSVHPGCSRKVNLSIDPSHRKNRLRIRSHGTVFGRPGWDRDAFRYE